MLRRAHEHPLKSIRATFVVIAAIAFRGMLLSSFEVVISGGVQSAVPPLIGTNARASTVNSTSPEAGAVKLTPDEENTPTLGLLAGTTRVYCLQFAFMGLPTGQLVLASTEINSVESTAAVAPTARMDSSGIVICRDADDPPGETVCNAASVTSAVAALAPFVAVTNPCKTPGAVAPVSAINGTVLRLVPLGTFSTTVALYGTLFEFTASITMSNVPVGNGQNRKFPFASAAVCITMRSMPMLSVCSMATSTFPAIGALVSESTACPPIPELFALTCPAVSVGFKRYATFAPFPSSTIDAQALKSIF